MDMVTLGEEWWADAAGNPVPYGDPRGRRVLYPRGARVPRSVADSLPSTTTKDVAAPPADKAVRQPRARK